MNDEITLKDFRRWFGCKLITPEKARVIEEQLGDPNSEAGLLMWLSIPDLSSPPPSLYHLRLPDDQVPQEFEPIPELEDCDLLEYDTESAHEGYNDGIEYTINSLNECIPVFQYGLNNMDEYIPVFPYNRTPGFNSYAFDKDTSEEDYVAWGTDAKAGD